MNTTVSQIKSIGYERVDCTRCYGTGYFGPVSVHNGKCFKCEGIGQQLTRAGVAAKIRVDEWVAEHMMVAASSLKPGDKIIDSWSTRRTVVGVVTSLGFGGVKSKSGIDENSEFYSETWSYGKTVIHTQKTSVQVAAHQPVRRAWTSVDLDACVAELGHLKGLIPTYR